MPLYITQGDITRIHVDAVVNPTDPWFSGSGGTDYAIHMAAGPNLKKELREFPFLEVGEAVITSGYALPAKYIIHTFGPIWRGGDLNEAELLASCYRNCLNLALSYNCDSLAFPLISGGTFGFPNDDAFKIAKATICEFLQEHELTVYIVAYQLHTFNLGAKLFAEVSKFVSDNYIELNVSEKEWVQFSVDDVAGPGTMSLEEMLRERGETFACMLDRLREERGMTGPELYKKAWMHKSVYSKIINNINYQPSKITAIAFGLALELSWEELDEFIASAGYALHRTSKFDIVIEYFVKQEKYDIEQINAVLNELDPDLPLIGF